MPSLEEHASSQFVKMLLIGDSGTGKTGALISLIEAGYHLRIIDMDNGLDALAAYARHKKLDLSKVQYETARDKYKATAAGPMLVPPARAFTKAGKLIDKWTDDTKPEEWGPSHILVIDSLTHMGRAAYAWAAAANPAVKHKQLIYGAGQEVMAHMIATITSEDFRTNVIVISHVDYRRIDENDEKSEVRGYVKALGRSLGKDIPSFFNTLLLAKSTQLGNKTKRIIRTVPTQDIDLKNPAAFRMDAEYPLETGLASIFSQLKE